MTGTDTPRGASPSSGVDLEVRPITEGEEGRFAAAVRHGYHHPPPQPDEIERVTANIRRMGHQRVRAVEDRGELVATGGVWPLKLGVPGGEVVGCAGVTWIASHPTHRRRGLLRRIMGELHAQARSDGDPVAALWSMESGIYARFGYGIASDIRTMRFDPTRIRFRDDTADPNPVRRVDRKEALRLFPEVSDAVGRVRPGGFRRDSGWWEERTLPADNDARLVVTEREGRPTGYAFYTTEPGLDDHLPSGTLKVQTVTASTPGAWTGLWRFLCGHDLIAKLEYTFMPADDPLPGLVTEPRRLRTLLVDGLWVRLLDIGASLAGRRYSTPLSVDLELSDPDHDMAARWHLETDGATAVCEPTEATPQIRLGLEDLGSCYLGRSNLAAAARAGRVTGDADVIRAADLAFSWDPPPHCPEIF